MTSHRYSIQTKWTGNNGPGTTDYDSYSRDHAFSAEGKLHEIMGSSDPDFLGDKSRFNPEELLLSSLSACHMLWYLHLCASNNVVVTQYVDDAEGVMETSADGSGKFSSVTLKPNVVVEYENQIARAIELHAEANRMCFIANSCNFPVKHNATTSAK